MCKTNQGSQRLWQTSNEQRAMRDEWDKISQKYSPAPCAAASFAANIHKNQISYQFSFCGVGTTLVEALQLGRRAVGGDVNKIATSVSQVKTTFVDPQKGYAPSLTGLAVIVGVPRAMRAHASQRPRGRNRQKKSIGVSRRSSEIVWHID
jgi:hypothetical protein